MDPREPRAAITRRELLALGAAALSGARTGAPRIFISHGTADEILPIDRCSRRIVPELRRGPGLVPEVSLPEILEES